MEGEFHGSPGHEETAGMVFSGNIHKMLSAHRKRPGHLRAAAIQPDGQVPDFCTRKRLPDNDSTKIIVHNLALYIVCLRNKLRILVYKQIYSLLFICRNLESLFLMVQDSFQIDASVRLYSHVRTYDHNT